MADTTMGQRIGERRRLLGLSQEALGEKLGVSRQAISKWESDGAVPEVDKLIALSRLFDVSVGWLLGTENISAEELPKLPAEASFRQNREAMLLRIACVFLGIAVMGLWFGQSRLRSRLDNTEAIIGALQVENNLVAEELHALRIQLQSLAEKEVDDSILLSDYSWEILSMNGSDHGRVFFTLIPKNWAEGDTATLVARYNGAVAGAEECTWDGFAFTGRLVLPPENGYEYYFTLTHSGINAMGEYVSTQEHQRLYAQEAENLARQLQVGCTLGVVSYGLDLKNGMLTLSDASVSAAMPGCLADVSDSRVSWTAMDLVLYKNGQEVDRVSPPGLLTEGDKSSTFHATIEQAELHFGGMEEGDNLELWLEASLSNGMTGRAFGEGWMLENGDIIKLEVVGED